MTAVVGCALAAAQSAMAGPSLSLASPSDAMTSTAAPPSFQPDFQPGSLPVLRTEFHHFTWKFGLGVTPVVGGIRQKLSTGFDFNAGAGYNFTPHFGVLGEFFYSGLGVTTQALRELSEPAGQADVWAVTVDPIWRFTPRRKVSAYVTGGIGFYRRTVQFLQPTTTVVTIFDPWWGYLGPALVPSAIVLGSVSDNALGANAGIGLAFRIAHSRGAKLFAEVRYDYANTANTATTLLPITFGFRW